jgi:DNA topoisomerase-3
MSKGIVIKGNTAYGCSHYKTGCDFKVTFDVREKLKPKTHQRTSAQYFER